MSTMALSLCPAAFVNAPIEVVWGLLADPSRYDLWWEARTERIEPAGGAKAGQTIQATSQAFGMRFLVAMRVESVVPEAHTIELVTTLPLGLMIQNRISCFPLGPALSRVQFG
jgi:hypothetical protein